MACRVTLAVHIAAMKNVFLYRILVTNMSYRIAYIIFLATVS